MMFGFAGRSAAVREVVREAVNGKSRASVSSGAIFILFN